MSRDNKSTIESAGYRLTSNRPAARKRKRDVTLCGVLEVIQKSDSKFASYLIAYIFWLIYFIRILSIYFYIFNFIHLYFMICIVASNIFANI